MTAPKDDKEEPEIKLNDLFVFPGSDAESKVRTVGIYGEINEEHCKGATLGLYYLRDTGIVEEYEEPEEAIKIANDTDYGLAAGIFTSNIDQATKTSNQLEAGQIYVNSWFTGSVATPFGGYKQSGYSREKGQEALKSYLQIKNVGIQI